MKYVYEDISACFATFINALEKNGIPKSSIVEAAQERLLTLAPDPTSLESSERLLLLRTLARLTDEQGRGD